MPSAKGIAGAAAAILLVGAIGSVGSNAVSSPEIAKVAETPEASKAVQVTSSSSVSRPVADQPSPASDSSASSSSQVPEEPASPPEDSSFSIAFLDVGQGDAAVISCDGHYMIVDGGPADASRLMYTYCKDAGISEVDYVVASHPDSDHTGGISGALQVVNAKRALCSSAEGEGRAFESMARYLGNQGVAIEVPAVGDTFDLGSATVSVVGMGSGYDNASIMLRITYGSTSFLLAGDAPEEEELSSIISGQELGSTLLKVAHHGSAGSSSSRFLSEVSPEVAVISVGEENNYGHPTGEALARLVNCGSAIYRTDLQGDIFVTSDGKDITVTVERNADADTTVSKAESQQEELQGISYIGNKRSHKFHVPTCKSLPKEENRVAFDSREDAVNAGYSPCGNCKP